MKNFLKVFIIVVLVVASVGGTCYFFFRNMKKGDNSTASIAGVLYSESKSKFNQDLVAMSALVNSDGTDNRIQVIIDANKQLDEIVEVLASYYIENDTKINNEKIAKSLNQVNSSRSLLNSMMTEYNIKKNSAYFNRHVGANDFYKESCNYLVSYAKFANYVNSNLSLNKKSDLKFSIFDIYTNVVIDTFSKTKTNDSKVVVENLTNFNMIDDVLELEDSYISTEVDQFSGVINKFNELYYDCNKSEFASNLTTNISTVTSENQTTNEKLATYYFKQIFDV